MVTMKHYFETEDFGLDWIQLTVFDEKICRRGKKLPLSEEMPACWWILE